DFTGDGVVDAVFQIHDTTYLVAGLGDGRFATALPILKGVNAPSFDRSLVAVADITADGLADLAVPDDQAIQLLIATGEGQFAPAEVVPIPNGYLASVALQPSDPATLSALIALDSCSID
ncbi:MAG TPA: VCBS repeat-containing protein, partial [Polyangiaceae bacterium]|nr:VCBS repeat-containing protein [Polyangiaceae bacterium]